MNISRKPTIVSWLTYAALLILALAALPSCAVPQQTGDGIQEGIAYLESLEGRSPAEIRSMQAQMASDPARDASGAHSELPPDGPDEPAAGTPSPADPSAREGIPADITPDDPSAPEEPSAGAQQADSSAQENCPADPQPTGPAAHTDEAAGQPSAPAGPSAEDLTLEAWRLEAEQNTVRMLSAEELAWFRNRLSDTVFIGDSLSQALVTDGVLPDSMVFYKRGAILRDLYETVDRAVASYPANVVFLKGLNDVDYESPVSYTEVYADLASRIRQAVPGVRTFICSLLPPSNALGAVREDLARSWMFDNELQVWCPGADVTYINLHWLVHQHLYLDDGIHFNKAFYQLFLRYVTVCVKGWEGVPR